MRFAAVASILVLALVPAVLPARADKVDLANGDSIEVEIVEETEQGLVVVHEQLGRMEIARSELKPPEPEEPGLFGSSFLRGWSRRVSLGLAGSQGNSQDVSLNSGVRVENDTDTYRGLFEGAYFLAWSTRRQTYTVPAPGGGTVEDVVIYRDRSTNRGFLRYAHDFKLSESRFYLFGKGRFAYDEFQLWQFRITGNGGVGYSIFKNEAMELRGEIGGGINWSRYPVTFALQQALIAENATSPNSSVCCKSIKGELTIGLLYDWQITDGQKFSFDFGYFPDVELWSQYRILADIFYEIVLSQRYDLSLALGITDEYDTTQRPEQNNLQYIAKLVYQF